MKVSIIELIICSIDSAMVLIMFVITIILGFPIFAPAYLAILSLIVKSYDDFQRTNREIYTTVVELNTLVTRIKNSAQYPSMPSETRAKIDKTYEESLRDLERYAP